MLLGVAWWWWYVVAGIMWAVIATFALNLDPSDVLDNATAGMIAVVWPIIIIAIVIILLLSLVALAISLPKRIYDNR